jgi:hypothetical protein
MITLDRNNEESITTIESRSWLLRQAVSGLGLATLTRYGQLPLHQGYLLPSRYNEQQLLITSRGSRVPTVRWLQNHSLLAWYIAVFQSMKPTKNIRCAYNAER